MSNWQRRFRQFLWPSWKTWTLTTLTTSRDIFYKFSLLVEWKFRQISRFTKMQIQLHNYFCPTVIRNSIFGTTIILRLPLYFSWATYFYPATIKHTAIYISRFPWETLLKSGFKVRITTELLNYQINYFISQCFFCLQNQLN